MPPSPEKNAQKDKKEKRSNSSKQKTKTKPSGEKENKSLSKKATRRKNKPKTQQMMTDPFQAAALNASVNKGAKGTRIRGEKETTAPSKPQKNLMTAYELVMDPNKTAKHNATIILGRVPCWYNFNLATNMACHDLCTELTPPKNF